MLTWTQDKECHHHRESISNSPHPDRTTHLQVRRRDSDWFRCRLLMCCLRWFPSLGRPTCLDGVHDADQHHRSNAALPFVREPPIQVLPSRVRSALAPFATLARRSNHLRAKLRADRWSRTVVGPGAFTVEARAGAVHGPTTAGTRTSTDRQKLSLAWGEYQGEV